MFDLHRRGLLSGAAIIATLARTGPAAAGDYPRASAATMEFKSQSKAYDYKPALQRLAAFVDVHLAAYGLPGATVSVADSDGFVACISAGLADVERRERVTPEHYFQIGSVSKSFAGLAILTLVDAGKLRLDDQVDSIISEARLPLSSGITVRHLLNHSSGLQADDPEFLAEREQLGFLPGSHFHYSNFGYQLLGDVVEKITGREYSDYLMSNVLTPLTMAATRPKVVLDDRKRYAVGYNAYFGDRPFPRGGRLATAPWVNETEASGCIGATSGQMAQYIRFLILIGSGPADVLLTETSRRAFVTPTIAAPSFGEDGRYALGLSVVKLDGDSCLHHTGGMVAFRSSLTVNPRAGVGAFAGVNANTGTNYRPNDITAYAIRLLRAVREGRPLPAPPEIGSPTAFASAKALTGKFRSGDGELFELVQLGDGLAIRRNGADLPLQPIGGQSFIVVGPGENTSYITLNEEAGARLVTWGSRTFHSGTIVPVIDDAAELRRYAGVYDSRSPWTGQVEIIARQGRLWIDGLVELVPMGDGAFRFGQEEWSPERIKFDRIVDGMPRRLTASGAHFMRL